jgi:hypothetical protein
MGVVIGNILWSFMNTDEQRAAAVLVLVEPVAYDALVL